MSGKEKPGVIHRSNRGRSAPDSKSKTDSGCFVDEEIERNGSSDSSQGSVSSPPAKEKDSKKKKPANKESNTNTALVSSSVSSAAKENDSSSHVGGKENVMNGDVITNGENETVVTENVDRVCDVVEKTRRASDFYCLYYSESPEGTLTKSDAIKLRRKPPVPPKPKIRRGSAPPSSFNHIDRIRNENKDLTKRFSYNENQSDGTAVNGNHEDDEECEKRKSVEARVLFFEAFAKDGVVDSTVFNNVQTANFKDSSTAFGSTDLEIESCNDSHSVPNCQDQIENFVPLADSETFSVESDNYYDSFNVHQEVHSPQQFVPLVEEEEFVIDGSRCFQSSVNSSTVNENCHDNSSENGRTSLDCVSEVEVVDGLDHFVADTNQNSVDIDFHEIDQFYSETVASQICSETFPVVQESDCHQLHNGVEGSKVSAKESDLLTTKASCNKEQVGESYFSLPDFEQGEQPRAGSSEKIVNPRLNELKQELLISSRSCKRNKAQRRPGSIAGFSNWEKDDTSQLKRRSWSFSEPRPVLDVHSPFVRKIYQVPAPKLTTSSWHSESGLSSPFVRSVQQPMQSTPNGRNFSRGKFGRGDHCTASASNLEYSGYASDDSSVHSEPLFQPLRHRPQRLHNGHVPKCMSDDSNISLTDNESSSFPKVQRRRVRHSLGSRDPIYALRRQSIEFATDEQPPLFRPVSPVHVPRLQTLRRASSYTSSSSDSEVEKIFKQPKTSTQSYQRHSSGGVHNGLVNVVTRRKVSAMEALFGQQSSRSVAHSSDSEQYMRKTLSERFSEVSHPPVSGEDFFSEELREEELVPAVDGNAPKEIEEPGLEFDDTDYSEFYTRCEDKDSIISAEALSIKKLLQSPQTVLPDADIESVVMSVTERKLLPSPENQEALETQNGFCENDTASVEETASELETAEQFYRRHRGTQTPPPAVFKALNPPPSVATQTPPIQCHQELPSSLLKELELQILTPTITRASPTMSESQEQDSPLLDHFQAVTTPSAPVTNTDMLSPHEESDKAVSVEELLQILASMQVGPLDETVSRRPVSVQKYNCSSPQNDNTCTKPNKTPKSLPSSWQHLSRPTGKQSGSDGLKKPSGVPPRSSKSYDCLRRGHSARERRADAVEAKTVRRSESSENIRKRLKEWKLRTQLFEEEVECQEDKEDKQNFREEKALKVSYDGSESTDNIETPSKLTNTHSLKRPRKDRAFSQKEKNHVDVGSFDEKQSLSTLTTKENKLKDKGAEDRHNDRKKLYSNRGEETKILEDTPLAESFQNTDHERLQHEVASPEGIDVFIDYRRKNGMHITSTPKPPTDHPENIVLSREDGVDKINLDKLDDVQVEKPAVTITKEDKIVVNDVESQGDASSSSYSSDDDRFGEFGGSTETVVFVDTEPSSGVSLAGTDLETLDLNLVGPSDTLLSVNNNDEEKDESHLDALLGEVRRSLNLELVDSDILDKAIERFKQRVSPSTQNKVRLQQHYMF